MMDSFVSVIPLIICSLVIGFIVGCEYALDRDDKKAIIDAKEEAHKKFLEWKKNQKSQRDKEIMNDDRYKLTMQEYVLGRTVRNFEIIDDKKIVITLEHYSKLELIIEHKEDGLLFYIEKHMI